MKEVLDRMRKSQDDEGRSDKKRPALHVEFEAEKLESEISSPKKKETYEVSVDFTALTAKVDVLTKLCKLLVGLVVFNIFISLYQTC